MELNSAVVACEGGQPVWRHVGKAKLFVRPLSDAFIEHYLDQEWPAIAGCVGCFRIEGPGVQLFSRIDGERVPGGRFCTPCGGCRQRLMEFAASPATEIWAADPDGASQRFTRAELLPAGFVLEE